MRIELSVVGLRPDVPTAESRAALGDYGGWAGSRVQVQTARLLAVAKEVPADGTTASFRVPTEGAVASAARSEEPAEVAVGTAARSVEATELAVGWAAGRSSRPGPSWGGTAPGPPTTC